MIGRISGELVGKQAPTLLISVQGLGYEVTVPMTSYYELPAVGSQITLSTHFVVREDAQLLFGFLSESDRDLFRVLIKVSGIGPKVALAILSGMTAGEVVRCVLEDDKAALVRLPGIGAKTAERLIMETRDRLKEGWGEEIDSSGGAGSKPDAGPVAEAEAALVALGYKEAEAKRAIASAAKATESESVEALIRTALRNLM